MESQAILTQLNDTLGSLLYDLATSFAEDRVVLTGDEVRVTDKDIERATDALLELLRERLAPLDSSNSPETHIFSCMCESDEHALVFKLWDWVDDECPNPDDVSLSVSVFLNNYHNFFQRIWIAIKYVFGYNCIYGHFDSTEFKYDDCVRLIDLIKRFKRKKEVASRYFLKDTKELNSLLTF